MRISFRIHQLALCLGACLVFANTVSAQFPAAPSVPAQCASDARNKQGWTLGKTAGDSRVISVWNSSAVHQNPDLLANQLDFLVNSLQTQLTTLVGNTAVTQYTRCRVQGYADGYFYRLNVLLGQCVLDGADWASFAANFYCDLSIGLGGLADQGLFIRTPVGLCGNLFETTCEDVYQYIASEGTHAIQPTVASYLQATGFLLQGHPGCAQYTTNAYLSTFQNAFNLECSYPYPYGP